MAQIAHLQQNPRIPFNKGFGMTEWGAMLCSAGLPGFIPSHYSLECMQNTYQLLLSTSAAAINCIVLASSIRHEPCSRIIIIKSERINCKDYLHSSSRRSHLCPLVMMLMKMDSGMLIFVFILLPNNLRVSREPEVP